MSSPVSHFEATEVFDSINLGLVVVDPDLKIVLWNQWMARHSRIAQAQTIHSDFKALLADQLSPGFLRALDNALKYGLPAVMSSALHRSPLPLFHLHEHDEVPVRMYQSIIITPLTSSDGSHSCLIQVSDSSTSVKREKMLMSHSETLKRQVVTDSLTGIYNRRFFDDSYASALKQAKRQQSALSLFMIDIDFFKQYNDHYGHMVGDKALKAVANALGAQMMRSTDVFARYGGEEFIILIPGFSPEQAIQFAERLRACVLALAIKHEKSLANHYMTISVGVDTCIPEPDFDGKLLLDRADAALYRAKQGGRNQVHASL